MKNPLREHLGVWLKDRLRYERRLRSPTNAYLGLANRTEQLTAAPDGSGYACRWRYTSRLHATGVQPQLGVRLLRRCLDDAPIALRPAPPPLTGQPEISVLIGHRGTERLPLLLATLESLAAQEGVQLECVVIEQDGNPTIAAELPPWVQHVHAPLPEADAPYNRSHAFNIGARHARGRVLLLHDNDMLVPCGYGRRILDRINRGYEVVNPKRYIFYLNQLHSREILEGKAPFDSRPPEAIVQNLEAGGSMAIAKSTYEALGGMDEGFVGWGGEDNEFWDRCLTRPTWVWGYEPILHLWHRSQPLKEQSDNPNLARWRMAMERSPEERIEALRQARLTARNPETRG